MSVLFGLAALCFLLFGNRVERFVAALPAVCDFYAKLRAASDIVFETPDGYEHVTVYRIDRP